MKPYSVNLELFEGPLDLLLYLIKREDMDIRDIPISQITGEYLAAIHLMKELNLEMAGEFLVMASTLLQIKARTLLPKEAEREEDEGPDPRAELVARLLEYQKYKEAAALLARREFDSREVYYRNVLPLFAQEDMTLEATLFDLLDAFRGVLDQAGEEVKELIYEEIPLEQKIREILDLLEGQNCVHFNAIFTARMARRELVVTFLALLELIRLKQVIAAQTDLFGEIRIYRVLTAAESRPDGGDAETPGEGPRGRSVESDG